MKSCSGSKNVLACFKTWPAEGAGARKLELVPGGRDGQRGRSLARGSCGRHRRCKWRRPARFWLPLKARGSLASLGPPNRPCRGVGSGDAERRVQGLTIAPPGGARRPGLGSMGRLDGTVRERCVWSRGASYRTTVCDPTPLGTRTRRVACAKSVSWCVLSWRPTFRRHIGICR